MDLLEPREWKDKLGGLTEVTHVFYAANKEQPAESGQVAVNSAMLRNLVEIVEITAPGLAHISLMQSTKAYGNQFGPF